MYRVRYGKTVTMRHTSSKWHNVPGRYGQTVTTRHTSSQWHNVPGSLWAHSHNASNVISFGGCLYSGAEGADGLGDVGRAKDGAPGHNDVRARRRRRVNSAGSKAPIHLNWLGNSGIRGWGLGFGVWGVGFGVQRLGCLFTLTSSTKSST